MLEIRQNCENCGTSLPVTSTKAMICSYECTFCRTCVNTILQNVCPNCGGGFEKRPIRPKSQLEKYPPKEGQIYKPVDMKKFEVLMESNKNKAPEER
ncbi:DUF1272 domain-containing protein [Leptobacterium sp. I13]|uniref:DUF1272 domain-containing protein n=1 Tax=Leptobacterium meishanense TaxID=3128904 RepID=UPI0030ECF861